MWEKNIILTSIVQDGATCLDDITTVVRIILNLTTLVKFAQLSDSEVRVKFDPSDSPNFLNLNSPKVRPLMTQGALVWRRSQSRGVIGQPSRLHERVFFKALITGPTMIVLQQRHLPKKRIKRQPDSSIGKLIKNI